MTPGFRRLAVPLFWALVTVACKSDPRLDFETATRVWPDGSVSRTTRYVVTPNERDILDERYVLPQGGTWRMTRELDEHAENSPEWKITGHEYTVTQQFERRTALPSDHIRMGKDEKRTLHNLIEVSFRDYFFVRTYDFREEFQDVNGYERFVGLIQQRYPHWVEQISYEFEIHVDGVSAEDASRAIHEVYDPWIKTLASHNWTEALRILPEDELVALMPWDSGSDTYDEEFEELLAALPPPPGTKDQRKQQIQQAMNSYGTSSTLEEFKELEMAFYGIYCDGESDCSSTYYAFRHTLRMPGTVLTTNAPVANGGTLTWEWGNSTGFVPLPFQAMFARSRLVYRERSAGTALAVLLASWGWIRLRRRRTTV